MTRTTHELAPPPPKFRTTPTKGCLTHDVRFNAHQAHKHGGSSVESGFEPGALRLRSRDLTIRLLQWRINRGVDAPGVVEATY
ncbi:hypothetical protein AVEN_273580-1 [Araneus ventricosus]|uniref:Uncharacterized protein n=1 Tax=Araneus ventricosus TaxID=182803 RepID=A0A4Y2PZZ2_ARAVE|nr:hypothetical protein AVEN_273580-1 [Araneus ventricosus]